jgi:hypothetical protein
MPEICTCGAQLPPDAVFCHKCGKPQRPYDLPEVEPELVPVVVLPPPVEPAPMTFRNPVAVRVALTVAVAALAGTLVSRILILCLLLWVAAGFFAVIFYKRRTGHLLNIKAGLRMGWMTGVLLYALTTVVFTTSMIVLLASGRLMTEFQTQFKGNADPNVQEALKLFQTGPGLAAMLLVTLFMLFISITLLSMVGGALGARMVGRD